MSSAVIIPTYNGEKRIANALSSVLRQTVNPSHLVVVIDGSSDCTRQVVENNLRGAPFHVTVHENVQNYGIGFSRQAGVEEVVDKVDYISFLSDDDVWHTNFLDRMLSFAKPDRITYCYYEQHDWLTGKVSRPYVRHPVFADDEDFLSTAIQWSLNLGMVVNFSSIIIPATILRRVSFKRDFRKGEDLAYFLDSLCQGIKYQFLDEVLVSIGIHEGRGSVHYTREERQKLLNYVTEKLRELGATEELIRFGMKDAHHWVDTADYSGSRKLLRVLLLRVPPVRDFTQYVLRYRRERTRSDPRVAEMLRAIRERDRDRTR